MLTIEEAIARQKADKKALLASVAMRVAKKPRQKPRKQAIKEAKAEVLNEAIQMMRNELRKEKLGGLPIQYERGYLSAISKLEILRGEIK